VRVTLTSPTNFTVTPATP
jgi:hypothetical protein